MNYKKIFSQISVNIICLVMLGMSISFKSNWKESYPEYFIFCKNSVSSYYSEYDSCIRDYILE